MAVRKPETHHVVPRCLLSLHEKANGTSLDGEGIQAWLEWEMEAMGWGVPVEISWDELEALVGSSEVPQQEDRQLLYKGDRSELETVGEARAVLKPPETVSNGEESMTVTFPLGRVVATTGALKVLVEAGEDPLSLLSRHCSGDWGELDAHDRQENELSLKNGWRVLSSYPVGEEKVWIITEADRSVTTILLPEEY